MYSKKEPIGTQLFFAKFGDKFTAKDCNGNFTVMEVISPFNDAGIPYGFNKIANTKEMIVEDFVYAVDTHDRKNIYKFKPRQRVVLIGG